MSPGDEESERLESSQEALAVLRHTNLVLDALPRAVMVWDLHATILAWNASAERLYGWTAEEVLGRYLGDALILPADLADAREIGLSVETGATWEGDVTLVRADGSPVRVHTILRPLRDATGTIVGTIGSADDVTVQRAVEERAAELTNHLLMALASGELGTWRRDLRTGVVAWDESMERLYGLEPGTFDGTAESWFAMLHPDDRDHAAAVIDDAVVNGDGYAVEYRVIRPDGEVRWLQGRALVTRTPSGHPIATIGCSGDVTDRKLVELENARRAMEAERLLEDGRLHRRRIEFLAGLNEAAIAADDHRSVMRAVTEAAVPMLGDWCSLHFYDGVPGGPKPEIYVAHHDPERVAWINDVLERHPFHPDAPIGAAAAIRSGRTQFIESFDEIRDAAIASGLRARPDEARRILDELAITSLIAVPLVSTRGVIGAMQFVSAESGRTYGPDDVALAEAAAGRVAAALDAAWMRDQQRTVATVLQSALLPERLPDVDGISVAVRYWAAGAASEVGGDFYDVFRLPPTDNSDTRWAVVIGDVCGTGPEAAAVTALARHTIRAAARHGVEPVEVLDWLNDAVLESDTDRFCTVLLCTVERIGLRWRLTSVAGGHPLPHLARGGTTAVAVGGPGTLIGVLPALRLQPATIDLEPGDTVVLNTDGITDIPGPYAIDEADMAELVTTAARCGGPAEAVAEHLGAAVQDHLPLDRRDDDIALVVLRITDGLHERTFEADVRSIGVAREFVVAAAARPDLDDSLRLAVSELATNAVVHAGTEFRVAVGPVGDAVRVEVHDHSTVLPVSAPTAVDAVGGRGIGIVDHLADRWGVTPEADGKVVWFELGS